VVRRRSDTIIHRRRLPAWLALVAALFAVGASFHQHAVPELSRAGIAADPHAAHAALAAAPHDCLACRVSRGSATLDATAPLPGQAPAPAATIRIAAVPVLSPVAASPCSPRAPPPSSLIRL
jgi:hypothetical protein